MLHVEKFLVACFYEIIMKLYSRVFEICSRNIIWIFFIKDQKC